MYMIVVIALSLFEFRHCAVVCVSLQVSVPLLQSTIAANSSSVPGTPARGVTQNGVSTPGTPKTGMFLHIHPDISVS